jgi:hypothetical protein
MTGERRRMGTAIELEADEREFNQIEKVLN